MGNSLLNTWRFQDQEHIEDLKLGWESFKWRNHMPDIGRFFNIDPIAEHYVYNSPYAFSENKLIAHIELEGLENYGAIRIQRAHSNSPQYYNRARTERHWDDYLFHKNGPRNMNGPVVPVRPGTSETPGTIQGAAALLAGNLIGFTILIRNARNEQNNIEVKRQVWVSKVTMMEYNEQGGKTYESYQYQYSGPDALQLRVDQADYVARFKEEFNNRYSQYAKTQGVDYNSLSDEEKSKFRSDPVNHRTALVMSWKLSMEMGLSPEQQVINQQNQLIEQKGIKKKDNFERLPSVGPGKTSIN